VPDFRLFFPALACALRFLTVTPIRWGQSRDGELFAPSVATFPIVGLLIGLTGWALAWLLTLLAPPPLVAWLFVFYLSGISGFLHLDGLADSADGLLSGRDRQKALAIMKDSRSGSMAVAVVVLVLLGKFAALSSLATKPASLLPTLLLAPLAGRTAICLTMAILPYARKNEGGIGGLFYTGLAGTAAKAAALGFMLSLLLGYFLCGWAGIGIIAISLAVNPLFAWFCQRKIGGATGDTLGAACELTELAALTACSLFFSLSGMLM
jgi:adenosylcobinamide-GDP ribazoletransferase